MNKYKYLAKNMGFLTISNFGTKILSFFLVPLYTSILTTEEYGTYDLFNTTIGILVPFLTLNV
nr:polysaccharide biosynthesis protein [Clostridium sp.]